MPNPKHINPMTGRRYEWELEQQRLNASKAAEKVQRDAQQELRQTARVLLAHKAQTEFMTFVKFTSPDPEEIQNPERSRYKNARHHDAIARVLEEVVKGEIPFLILTMPPRHGKQIADDTPVLTPDGWRKHGELRSGDEVFGVDGRPVKILAVAEPLPQNVEVVLTDGSVVAVHENHEWTVYDRSKAKWRTMETREWLDQAIWSGERARFQLPDIVGVEFEEKELPLDPYTLGVWLGDGSVGTGRIDMAAGDEAVWRRIEATGMPISSETVHPDTGVKRIHFGNGKPGVYGPLTSKLLALGVLNAKAIPEIYLRASREQRLALLAGLMDTDGHVEPGTGRCRIVTTREQLRDGVVDLCTTLGFRPYVTMQIPPVHGGPIQGKLPAFTIGFQPTEIIPVSLDRRRVCKHAVRRRIGVRAVRSAPDQLGRCIQVDNADGLYLVGKNLLPTHNSELVSRKLPAWFAGKFPDQSIVVATYNDDFAADFGKDVRFLMLSPSYKQVFPGVQLRRGGAASDRLQTTQGGQLSFVGRGGSLTGRGAGILICDDLIKDDKEAQSQAIRDQSWNWFTKVAMSRRMGKKLVVLTFTRWHSDDPIGRLTDPENPYYNRVIAEKIKIINLPAIAEDDDPLGREPGQPLWPDGPDRFDLDFLAEQQALDPLGFAALYQQRPSLLDGDLFKRENIKFYKPDQLPDELRVYCASDHAVAVGQRNDFTVLLKVGIDAQANIYLLDCYWRKAKSDIVVEAMLDMARGKHRPILWWAEKGHISKAIGPFLKKRMMETNTYINLREVTPAADKLTRAQSIAGRVAQGKVYFPENAFWTEKLINQMMAFPNGPHDDGVDALAYIGLGLQSQFAARSNPVKKADKNPVFGTLNWVKLADKWANEKRALKAAGGF